jgi:hypothetical protein
MQENAQVQQLVDGIVRAVCIDLFRAYGVALQETHPPAELEPGLAYCGVVGFAGPSVRGTCLLATTEGPLVQSDPVRGASRDWIGELVNQLVGRVKNRVLAHGLEFYVTTPVVIRGQHIAPLPHRVQEPLAFAGANGYVLVWIEVETIADFVPSEAQRPIDAASEGDTLLF